MAGLKLTEIQKSYGDIKVLHSIDLDVESGEFIVFVGPSGCGKSTLLRLIAGLERITGGTLEINGQVVNDVPPASRGIAMVFQSYALYPHMTVYNNMAFGQKLAKATKEEIDRRVRAAADLLQITDYLDRLPKALSGGQRQRVAIGRAIVRDPDVFLFDEPLSNLDAALRVATRIEIAKLHERLPETTMIYVTHDQVEAMTLADRIVVLNGGYIEQVGSPLDLYERPNNLFVARFIGSPAMNIIPARLESAGSQANGGTRVTPATGATVAVPVDTSSAKAGDEVMFGIRPEDLTIANGADHVIEGTVEFTEKLGEVTLLYITNPQASGDGAGGITEDALIAKVPGIADVSRGETVRLTADPSKIQVFSKDGQAFAH